MATVSIKQLFAPTVLTTSAATLFTAGSLTGTTVVNGMIRFTNTTAGAITVTAYAVPNGGSAAAGNQILNAESVAGNSHLDTSFPQLGPSDFIQALASANTSITASCIAGVTYTP